METSQEELHSKLIDLAVGYFMRWGTRPDDGIDSGSLRRNFLSNISECLPITKFYAFDFTLPDVAYFNFCGENTYFNHGANLWREELASKCLKLSYDDKKFFESIDKLHKIKIPASDGDRISSTIKLLLL